MELAKLYGLYPKESGQDFQDTVEINLNLVNPSANSVGERLIGLLMASSGNQTAGPAQ